MSTLAVNTIVDANSGNTTQINGMTPTADSLQGFRNRIINGGMVIDQRNAGAAVTPTSGNNYTLDRWLLSAFASSKLTIQQNAGSVTPPAGFQNYLGVTTASAYTPASGEYFVVGQRIEGFNWADLSWGTANAQSATLSFWVRSSITGTHSGALNSSSQTHSYVFSFTVSAANTWEYKTVVIPGPTSGTFATNNTEGLWLNFNLGSGANFQTSAGSWVSGEEHGATGAVSVVGTNGATFYITGVQLEAGSVATPFERRPYGTELALCQRYYEVLTTSSATFGFPAYCANTSIARGAIQFKVTKRASPTVAMPSLGSTNINCVPGNFNPISTTFSSDTNSVGFDLTVSATPLTSGQGCSVGITGTGITLSAEL